MTDVKFNIFTLNYLRNQAQFIKQVAQKLGESPSAIAGAMNKQCPSIRRGIAAGIALGSIFIFSSSGSFAAANKKEKSTKAIATKETDATLGSALPFRFDGYTVGSPAEKSDYTGVESGVDNPDERDKAPLKNQYYITCLAKFEGFVPIYKKWNKGPRKKEIRGLGNADNMNVIYFISDRNTQYIYGMILDGRGLTNGVPIIIESKYWDCKLYK
ncbi:hypothetical protein [Microvirga alba]|uniref:Uncharacterized protein n=1 Tax=Microvirga alba TaxID=2791025 RepID=A0A931BN23_9HYPH|nr:hypothetical protein [Microvirga alba]MBF9232320.1 hypothetical protein [Microvirga alba]